MGFRILTPTPAPQAPAVQSWEGLNSIQRELLALLALNASGVTEEVLVLLYRCVGSTPDARFAVLEMRRTLAPLARSSGASGDHLIILGDYGMPPRIISDAMRRRGLDYLQSSGMAERWRRALSPAQQDSDKKRAAWYTAVTYSDCVQRLALLAGASVAESAVVYPKVSPRALIAHSGTNLTALLGQDADPSRLDALHPSAQVLHLGGLLILRTVRPMADTPALLQRLEQLRLKVDRNLLPHRDLLLEHALLRGDFARARQEAQNEFERQLVGIVEQALASRDASALLAQMESLEKALPRELTDTMPVLPDLAGAMQVLALAASADPAAIRRLKRVARVRDDDHPELILPQQIAGLAIESVEASIAARPLHPHVLKACSPDQWIMGKFAIALARAWSGDALPVEEREQYAAMAEDARQAQWPWLAAVFQAAVGGQVPDTGPWTWRTPEPAWSRALRALRQFADGDTGAEASAKHSRVEVLLNLNSWDLNCVHMKLYESRPTAKGKRSRRVIENTPRALETVLARLGPQDTAGAFLLKNWMRSASAFGAGVQIESATMTALVGYPDVQVEGPDAPAQVLPVVREDARLRIESLNDGRVRVAFDPPPTPGCKRVMRRQADKLLLTDFSEDLLRLHAALGDSVEMPEQALQPLLDLTPKMSRRLTLETHFSDSLHIEHLDPRIHVLIEPLREGLSVRLRVRPLGTEGVLLLPGAGQAEVLGVRERRPVHGLRDLSGERRALDRLLDAVPHLLGAEGGDSLAIGDPEQALEALSRLTELGDDIELIWPEGKRWSMSRTRGLGQLRLSVSRKREWFHTEGALELEDGQVVSLAMLLEALPSSQGRFLRLGKERVLALSQDLSRQLHSLRALADDKGKIELAAVAAQALQPLIEAAGEAEVDKAFRAQLRRIETAEQREHPLPTDFQAELRDYQIEGYRWMMRLADWGAGACLADDMGLGKTIQALAVLVARASAGPALVVAPTSVVANWRQEARRFAPGLELRVYGDGDRSESLDSLGPGVVLLVSYGLLTLSIERFAAIDFATLVLDEAQAVKNAAAQRTLAVRQLQARFRIATTGTPIENHLGELWSLMRILNPGLLGSQERFAKRFVTPLERNPRAPERETLRRLIGPFLLRRLKSQVLEELPARTEIVLSIEPPAEEARLLAAVRKQSIERLAAGELPEEAKRFHVLAELTRMRRAACHPSLVAPELNLPGAKLEQLVELVGELRENRHRALVFSQFVDFLALVRAAFDQAGISYQYLDGSTAPKAREAAVSAFQGGQGDVFLLSLKAGGVGLNLTAADYVIHLDPWWNPAVEQQATDRAHRIGQTRPVTVYKLVVKGSIEEQILSLHGDKRELVDSVLGEQDVAGRLSVAELVALLG